MSNILTIQKTIFHNYPENTETYGFRAYDDNGSLYCNSLDREDLDLPDKEFIAMIQEECDNQEFEEMIESSNENEKYLLLNGNEIFW